ncbi:phosphoribosylaminoimidazole-succinocarboxamide synthase [Citrus sinensis]|uniref:Phosphoribosylaminoimidazole-succinocarboxamide synthase n=1 Tax=Citrus sinensis TaxID=2711 RepID=A0ACB8KPS9_CITSI|nr:phosphoribosylaminoimidazole-succinocarboxamide synthase [Citrus sinensis]
MAECMRTTLNPPKTPLHSNKISAPKLSFSSSFSSFGTKPNSSNSNNYPRISLSVMSNKNQNQNQNQNHHHHQQYLSLDAVISSNRKAELLGDIKGSLSNRLSETNLHLTVPGLKSKTRGKVRDIYDGGDYLVLVTTDRQSAFDRILASIPFKGQVLNETSLWWFDQTRHITPNAVISSPDKNVTIAKKCSVIPVEFVGLVKNQKLPANILTPTTKAEDHDVPVTPDEIVKLGLMTEAEFDEASRKALRLFEYGQRVASEHGLILVDTKYEFGKSSDDSILLIDEVHTPDSSRYWIAHSYEERFQSGLEPENVDKVLPDAPEELICELAWRYIFLYEAITKSRFDVSSTKEPIHDRISRNVSSALSALQ